MLTISYILSAGLELAIVFSLQKTGSGMLLWVYGFLLMTSLVSVGVDNSVMGEQFRSELKASGINIEHYDIGSNLVRSIIYLAALQGFIEWTVGALLAYGTIAFFTFLGARKLMI